MTWVNSNFIPKRWDKATQEKVTWMERLIKMSCSNWWDASSFAPYLLTFFQATPAMTKSTRKAGGIAEISPFVCILNMMFHLESWGTFGYVYIYAYIYIYLFFVTHNVHNVLQRRLCVQKSCPFKQTKLASPSSLRPNVHQASLAGLQEMCSSWKFSWQLQLSSVQNRGYLLYEGDYTTQLYRDYNKPL